MIPRCKIGKGITGAVRYILGEGRDPESGELNILADGQLTRVDWFGGIGFGFEIDSRDDADLARRIMEFDAQNQSSRTRRCEMDCVHLALCWRPGEEPTKEQMAAAAHDALAAIGMGNARALFAAHNDESYAHLHIVASKINPDTGRAYDLLGDFLKLSTWAEAYEREHSGGIVCSRREEANQLRDAIGKRDAATVVELMTQQRATFRERDLDRVLFKQVKDQDERGAFVKEILTRPEIVSLSDVKDGPVTRYTTKSVLEAERQVLRASDGLAGDKRHEVDEKIRARVLGAKEFDGISREQARAFRQATGPEGIAIIDGQAGTGKSFSMAAIRKAYEAQGDRVIGLAPTNAVAQDMGRDGFARATTIHSELFAVKNGRTKWNSRTVLMVDEAAMIDTKLMAQVTTFANQAKAKLILVGDDRQLSSIDRGGMFAVLKDRHGAAELSEVRRQSRNDDRRAAELMAEGNFHDALARYDEKGGIKWTRTQEEAQAALVRKWAADTKADPSKTRFVFAYTNDDVSKVNFAIRKVRRERGELGEDHIFATGRGQEAYAAGDRLQIIGTDKQRGLLNGHAGTIAKIEDTTIHLQLDGRAGRMVAFDAEEFKQFRHGYAGTIYKGQGRTLDQTYLYHSEHWRSAASYVALTRHRDKAEVFVARNTAANLKELARQMARVDNRKAASHFYRSGEDNSGETVSQSAEMNKAAREFADPQSAAVAAASAATAAAPQVRTAGKASIAEPIAGVAAASVNELGNAAAGAARLAGGVADVAENAIDALAEGLASLLGGGSSAPTPQQQPKGPPAMTAKEQHEARLKAFRESDQQQRAATKQETARRLGASDAMTDDELRREEEAQQKRSRDRGGGRSL
jgi:Ti-type conjugative transfer relaxase TraA